MLKDSMLWQSRRWMATTQLRPVVMLPSTILTDSLFRAATILSLQATSNEGTVMAGGMQYCSAGFLGSSN